MDSANAHVSKTESFNDNQLTVKGVSGSTELNSNNVLLSAPEKSASDDVEQHAGIDTTEPIGAPVAVTGSNTAAAPDDSFPEGGLEAWLVLAGSFLGLIATFGFMVSVGTVQEYLQKNQLSHYTARDVGWIPSVFVYLALGLGIWVGPVFDRYGARWLALIGSICYVAMVFLLAECKVFWQFLLCLGVLGGASGAALVTTAMAVISHWFKRRRGLAHGIAMSGSSIGGMMFPMILRRTLPRYGYAWSIRIVGFVILGCLILCNILMKTRLPPSPAAKQQKVISLGLFGDLKFTLLTISVFGFEIVLFGALGILPTYATYSGKYPADTGFYIIAVLNGVSSFGRIIPGYVSDFVGRFNTLLIMIVFTLVMMLALWLPFGNSSLAALYAFCALFGFGTGAWMALTPACIGQLCEAEHFGRYYGTLYFIASLATLICVPISGELVETVGPQTMVGFMCAVLGMAMMTMTLSRWACLGYRWQWRTKV